MIRVLAIGVLLIAALFSQGCIAGAYLAVKAVYGVVEKGDTIGMNYHAEPPVVWDAAQTQLADMELAPKGKPPPIGLARAMMSGTTSSCWCANQRPVRPIPLCTSSKMSRQPRSSHSRRNPAR